MISKFFSGVAILILALVLQFLLISSGLFLNLVFATLITFAFIFDFWELLVLDLIAVFIVSWQPAPSVALILFAVIPLMAYGFRRFTHWHGWIGTAIAIVIGFLLFYIVSVPEVFLGHLWRFFVDLAIGLIVGEIELSLMA